MGLEVYSQLSDLPAGVDNTSLQNITDIGGLIYSDPVGKKVLYMLDDKWHFGIATNISSCGKLFWGVWTRSDDYDQRLLTVLCDDGKLRDLLVNPLHKKPTIFVVV